MKIKYICFVLLVIKIMIIFIIFLFKNLNLIIQIFLKKMPILKLELLQKMKIF